MKVIMEYDRFATNSKLYILGIVCLIISLSLLFISLYILPFLIWNLRYQVPALILNLQEFFHINYNYTIGQSNLLLWLVFFIPSVITGFISYLVSNRIDNQIYKIDTKTEEEEKSQHIEIQKEIKDSASLGFKILLLMIAIVVIIFLLQYFVQSTS